MFCAVKTEYCQTRFQWFMLVSLEHSASDKLLTDLVSFTCFYGTVYIGLTTRWLNERIHEHSSSSIITGTIKWLNKSVVTQLRRIELTMNGTGITVRVGILGCRNSSSQPFIVFAKIISYRSSNSPRPPSIPKQTLDQIINRQHVHPVSSYSCNTTNLFPIHFCLNNPVA